MFVNVIFHNIIIKYIFKKLLQITFQNTLRNSYYWVISLKLNNFWKTIIEFFFFFLSAELGNNCTCLNLRRIFYLYFVAIDQSIK